VLSRQVFMAGISAAIRMDESAVPRPELAVSKTITLGRQLLVCLLICAIAAAIVTLFSPRPTIGSLFAGLPLTWQAMAGLLVGAGFAVIALLGIRRTSQGAATRRMVGNYARLDLCGWNPLWFSLLAGFGEELLFRGALQPLVGLWIASLLFVLAHARAYRFRAFDRNTVAQACGLFGTSVALGLIARFGGLLTAMIVHTAIDIAGLYTIRRFVREHRVPISA
jgi:membrane protease YdiL (CAAX protease family)